MNETTQDAASHQHWGVEEWLSYYGECRDMLWGLGQKFNSTILQASVFATAVSGALIWLRRFSQVSWPQNLSLALIAVLALFAFWWLASRYYLQAIELGTLMRRIEEEEFKLPQEKSALRLLRENAPLFKHRGSGLVISAYMAGLGLLVILVSWGGG